jgi:FdhE protein
MLRRGGSGASAARAARAHALKTDTGPAADLLAFYADLVEYQQGIVDRWERGGDRTVSAPAVSGFSQTSGSLLYSIHPEWVGRAMRDFTLWLTRLKPDATNIGDVTDEEWRNLFESYRAHPDDAAAQFGETAVFVLEAVLQPIAEYLAASLASGAKAASTRCPVCQSAPVVAVLREEGHGARRRLVCGLCFTEWDHLRVVCLKCGEQGFEALPVFSAEQYPHARVDACDVCRTYVKTIDATKDGRAIPVVDDLATIALDLWAREQGYSRVRANLLRIRA